MSDTASILVVDDEENLRRSLAMILERVGYSVTTAASVAEARNCLQSGAYNLVFLDLKLPDAGGHTLLPELHSQYPDMPVIILTAHDKLGVALDADRSAAVDFLLKPVDPAILLARIKEVLAGS